VSALPQPDQRWLDRYEIRDELGRGGFGRVYLADDLRLDREVAIKVLRQSDDFTDTDYQRFRREINIAARLSHPNVVTVYDGGDHEGLSYLVMRYVEGHDLRKELKNGPLPTARLVSVIEQIAGALDYAHGLGLVHRDVKPGNILCEEQSDRVYLADFGISRPVDQSTEEQLTQAGLGPATFYYAAPEQLRTGQRIDARTDIYALGCVLYECLTAGRPFEGKIGAVIGAHLHEPPPRVTDVRRDLSQHWDDVVARAMAKVPGDRYGRCGELAEAVATLSPTGARATYVDERALAHTVAKHAPSSRTSRADTPRTSEPPPPRAPAPHERAVHHSPRPVNARPDTQRFRATEVRPASPPVRRPPRSTARGRWTFLLLFLALAAMAAWLFWPNLSAALGGGAQQDPPPEVAAEQEPAEPEERGLDDDQRQLLETVGVFSAEDCQSPQRPRFDGVRTAISCGNGEQTPTRVVYRAFDDETARDAAFEELSAGRPSTADCRTGQSVRHPYRNASGEGQVLCVVAGGEAGITWTVPGQPIMGSSRLDTDTLADLYGWWDGLVDRDPGDRLPECPQDQGLIDRGALDAVQCQLTGGVATIASNAQFAGVAEMDAWYDEVATDARDNRLQELREGGDASVCAGLGVGDQRWTGGLAPWAIDGADGRLLCFTNESDLNVVFWTDNTTAIGSVAVSPAASGPLDQLVVEWAGSPYRTAD